VVVTGRVQGVFFRHETSRRALATEVAGWVRNLPGGKVEAVFEGETEPVEAMIRWCRSGPPLARVKEVQVEWEEPLGERGFRVR
jgi:acylphosphatase